MLPPTREPRGLSRGAGSAEGEMQSWRPVTARAAGPGPRGPLRAFPRAPGLSPDDQPQDAKAQPPRVQRRTFMTTVTPRASSCPSATASFGGRVAGDGRWEDCLPAWSPRCPPGLALPSPPLPSQPVSDQDGVLSWVLAPLPHSALLVTSNGFPLPHSLPPLPRSLPTRMCPTFPPQRPGGACYTLN